VSNTDGSFMPAPANHEKLAQYDILFRLVRLHHSLRVPTSPAFCSQISRAISPKSAQLSEGSRRAT
jgi:hypothetical protein